MADPCTLKLNVSNNSGQRALPSAGIVTMCHMHAQPEDTACNYISSVSPRPSLNPMYALPNITRYTSGGFVASVWLWLEALNPASSL